LVLIDILFNFKIVTKSGYSTQEYYFPVDPSRMTTFDMIQEFIEFRTLMIRLLVISLIKIGMSLGLMALICFFVKS